MQAGWRVNFSSDPSVGLPSQTVRVPAARLVVGFSRGGGGGKSVYIPPSEIAAAYAELAPSERPRGLMFWNMVNDGGPVNGSATETADFARSFNAILHTRPAPPPARPRGAADGSAAEGFTPYEPTDGWTYHLEARRDRPWPACEYRFLSSSDCRHTGLATAPTADSPRKEFTLEEVEGGAERTFHLRLSCGKYLSVAGPCEETVVDTWPQAGIRQVRW